MTGTTQWRHALASALALCAIPTLLAAQDQQVPAPTGQPPETNTFSFVLQQAGQDTLNPFGAAGRREVLQLQAGRTALRGQFRRARIDRLGQDDWTSSGWYEIRGGIIQLYHSDANGNATGRVEVGRYLENTICLSDLESGQPLAFTYLRPTQPASTSATTSATTSSSTHPTTLAPADQPSSANSCAASDGAP